MALSTVTCVYKKMLFKYHPNRLPVKHDFLRCVNNQVPTTLPRTQVLSKLRRTNEGKKWDSCRTPSEPHTSPSQHPSQAAVSHWVLRWLVYSCQPDTKSSACFRPCPQSKGGARRCGCSVSVSAVTVWNRGLGKQEACTPKGPQDVRWYTNTLHFNNYTLVFMWIWKRWDAKAMDTNA